jgi:Tol biopolymer transport system component
VSAATAGLAVGAIAAGAAVWYATRQPPAAVSRLNISTSGTAQFVTAGYDREIAISPDGRPVAYVGANGTIYVRALDQLEPTAIGGFGIPRGLFFSPDGQWIGFFDSANALQKVAVTGGTPTTVCRLSGPPRGRLGSGRHDRVRDERCRVRRLLRVSAHGGDVTVLTTPSRQNGEAEHLWPEFLPNGKAVLFTIVPVDASIENARIAAFDPARGTQHMLLDHGIEVHYRMDLMLLSLTDPSHRVQPLIHTPAAEQNAEVSPNGRWLAYQSNASGRFEVYVTPFPNVDAGQWKSSTDGGIQPLWSKKGDELFYLAPGGSVMGVHAEDGVNWKASGPAKLFDNRYYHGVGAGVGRTYDVSVDGKRFLMVRPSGNAADTSPLIVVQNWFTELSRLVRSQ